MKKLKFLLNSNINKMCNDLNEYRFNIIENLLVIKRKLIKFEDIPKLLNSNILNLIVKRN